MAGVVSGALGTAASAGINIVKKPIKKLKSVDQTLEVFISSFTFYLLFLIYL